MNMTTTIPIAFGCSTNYLPYLSVAIKSICINCSDNQNYAIYILHDQEFNLNKAQKLLDNLPNNITISFIDLTDKIKGLTLKSNKYISSQTYYSLFVSSLLPLYQKIIFLDCDLIVLKDLKDLYSIDIGNQIMGGTHNLSSPSTLKYLSEIDLLPEEYINVGVLLINVTMYNELKILDKCISLISSNHHYKLLEQDMINITCRKKLFYLDINWNLQWHAQWNPKYTLFKNHPIPYIIHYTSPKKPWNTTGLPYSSYFWEYAKLSAYANELTPPS